MRAGEINIDGEMVKQISITRKKMSCHPSAHSVDIGGVRRYRREAGKESRHPATGPTSPSVASP